MKNIFTILLLGMSADFFGQDSTPDSSKTGIVEDLKFFLDKACLNRSDTIVTATDSIAKYKVIFITEGDFIDPKNDLFRVVHEEGIRKEDFFAYVMDLGRLDDSLMHFFGSSSCQPIRTDARRELWGEPLRDSLINIQSDPSFWASCIGAREVRFTKEIEVNYHFKPARQDSFTYPSIISYQNGKYLLIDIMVVFSIGNQTDKGIISTYYLERVEQ